MRGGVSYTICGVACAPSGVWYVHGVGSPPLVGLKLSSNEKAREGLSKAMQTEQGVLWGCINPTRVLDGVNRFGHNHIQVMQKCVCAVKRGVRRAWAAACTSYDT